MSTTPQVKCPPLTGAVAILLTMATLAAGQDIQVKTLAGTSYAGKFVSLSTEQLVIDTGETVMLPTSGLMRVSPTSPAASPQAAKPTVWVDLIDGSQLMGLGYKVTRGVATLRLLSGTEVQIQTRSITAVRFNAQSAAVADQWSEILDEELSGDALVVRKRRRSEEDGPTTEVLDYLEGVLLDINDASVGFEFDDDEIQVPRTKVEGLVYFHPVTRNLPEAVCQITTAWGSTWTARTLRQDGENLEFTTTSGVKHQLPLNRISLFDFSTGKIAFLSDLKPDKAQWQPFLDASRTGDRAAELFAFRRDRNFDGGPLKLGRETYEKGLAIHSRSTLVYRLPGKFRQLTAMAGIDASMRGRGHVRLVITGDGKPLFDEAISGRDEPRPLEIDLTGVRRLQILVDFGEDLDIADHLDLCNARITK